MRAYGAEEDGTFGECPSAQKRKKVNQEMRSPRKAENLSL
jgi:hypothetical protein